VWLSSTPVLQEVLAKGSSSSSSSSVVLKVWAYPKTLEEAVGQLLLDCKTIGKHHLLSSPSPPLSSSSSSLLKEVLTVLAAGGGGGGTVNIPYIKSQDHHRPLFRPILLVLTPQTSTSSIL